MLVSRFDAHVDFRAMAYDPMCHGIPRDVYGALAMAGEAGECAGKVKKVWRDCDGDPTPERKAALLDELGDTLFYLTYTAHTYGFTLADVMRRNVIKLKDRAARGVTKGDGDHR